MDGEWVEQKRPLLYNPALQKESGSRVSVKDVIAIGKLIWAIVDAGEPVLDFESERLSVLPKQAKSAFELSNWSSPQSSTYKIVYENMLGFEMVSFSYRVVFTPNGKYQGVGDFLTNVAIEPVEVDVSWGYQLDAQFEAMEVLNIGSEENPIAAVELQLRWSVDTLVQKTLHQSNFFITGTGDWFQL